MRLALAFVCLVACSASPREPTDEDIAPTVKIAFTDDFAGYHQWTSFTCGIGAPGNDHVQGPRRVYVNKLPAPDATAFPVGTIFVKESGDGAPADRHVFASVKRGADFNITGARNWEFFELTNGEADHPIIAWRGFGPTNGDAYGGDKTGGCNGCHSADHWDYVWSAEEFALLRAPVTR